MKSLNILAENMKAAVWNRQNWMIGGGEFRPEEIESALKDLDELKAILKELDGEASVNDYGDIVIYPSRELMRRLRLAAAP